MACIVGFCARKMQKSGLKWLEVVESYLSLLRRNRQPLQSHDFLHQ